jgi:hypothetical protein
MRFGKLINYKSCTHLIKLTGCNDFEESLSRKRCGTDVPSRWNKGTGPIKEQAIVSHVPNKNKHILIKRNAEYQTLHMKAMRSIEGKQERTE